MNQTRSAMMILLVMLLAIPLGAAEPGSLEETTKKTQNPVADLIKVQFQNYFSPGMGADKVSRHLQNVIPTIPFKLNEHWYLITRTDLPLVNQPSLAPGDPSAFGTGDLNPQLYLVPKKSGGFHWGVGPSFSFPTATDDSLGSGKWSAGPAAVVTISKGPWVVGTRINNMWSFAGDRKRQAVNQLWVQPYVHYNLRRGWYLATLPSYTANWKASKGSVWTVPLGAGMGKQTRVSESLSIDTQFHAFYNVKRPDEVGKWQLMFQVQVLFPK